MLYSNCVGEADFSLPFPVAPLITPAVDMAVEARFEPADFEVDGPALCTDDTKRPNSAPPKGGASPPPVDTDARRSRKGSPASASAPAVVEILDADIDDAELTEGELAMEATVGVREVRAGVVAGRKRMGLPGAALKGGLMRKSR